MRTSSLLTFILILALPLTARADELYGSPNDYGRVTYIRKGVWEIDLGALGVLTHDREGDASVTRLSTDFSASVHRFFRDNLSLGVRALFDYDSVGGGNHSVAFGGALDATVHLRLGLGAFFRPGISVGALFGHHNIPVDMTTVQRASQFGVITRLQLPIAYFAGKRVLLQAGPQLNVTLGRYSIDGAMGRGFTRVAGGFAVGVGYVF